MPKHRLRRSRYLVRAVAVVGALALAPVAAVGTAVAARAPAQDLALTGPVVAALVNADAAFKHLPVTDFVGLQAAYYGYDTATSTYWAGAQVVPSTASYAAEVASQDDGGYTVFHQPAGHAWVAIDDGLQGANCARSHASIPTVVLAAWHWPAGSCTPPNQSGALLRTYYGQAVEDWRTAAGAISAEQSGEWLNTSKELEAAISAKAPGTTGFAGAARQLVRLSKLPDAMMSAAQSKEYVSAVTFLNDFFGTNGLYGRSAPSATTRAFVATLAQEADLGTLSAMADPRLGKVPGSLPQATVTCPVLTAVTSGSVFGCKLSEFEVYYFIGTILTDQATTYLGYMVGKTPQFECKADGFNAAEARVAKKLAGGCTG